MKKLFAIAVIIAAAIVGCQPQGTPFPFKPGMGMVENNPHCLFWEYRGPLNAEQQKALAAVKAKKEVIKTEIVRVNWQVADDGQATVCLPTGVCLPIRNFVFIKDKDENGFLKYNNDKTGTIVFVSKSGPNFTGLIYTKKDVVALEPLAGGLHVLSVIDQSIFPKD